MSRPKKLIFGIRPEKKWFRLMDHIGEIIDLTLRAVESNEFPVGFFTEVRRGPNNSSMNLRDAQGRRILTITEDNFIFACDSYGDDARRIDFDECYRQLSVIWNVFSRIMEHGGIRRIGILAEFKFESDTQSPSKTLLNTLSTLKRDNAVGKFLLQFQDMKRFPGDNKAGAIDEEQDAFINVIEHYYDGLLDAEHPKSGTWHASIDYQHYFKPTLKKRVLEEIFKMRGPFLSEMTRLKTDIALRTLISKKNMEELLDESSTAARNAES